MKKVNYQLSKIQHYPYKTTYVHPLKWDAPAGESGIVVAVYEDEKKDKLLHYEIDDRFGHRMEVKELPNYIILP